jgi:hypothetical protein
MRTKIAIVICATKSYTYALPACLRSLSRNVYKLHKQYPGKYRVRYMVVGDASLADFDFTPYFNFDETPANDYTTHIDEWTEGENYQRHAQLTIAQMRSKSFEIARAWDADFCWSVDSDVLIPDNGLSCSLQMLDFDDGYYSIACCPYPSQGGGSFLTGRGTRYHTILPDFDLKEREVDEATKKRWDAAVKLCRDEPENPAHAQARHDLMQEIQEKCPPKHGGDIWKLNAEHGWRRRGWLDFAYPALGRGAVVPVDWCGFGATLMDRDALGAADFTGYDGAGTEDLFVIWKQWHPRRFKLCSILHCPCDHIVRTGETKKLVHVRAYHEEHEETEGHLRRENRPFYQHSTPDERYDPDNDGIPAPPKGAEAKVPNPTKVKRKRNGGNH